jgi:hypothetical protein
MTMKISLVPHYTRTVTCYSYCGEPNRPLRIRSLMPPLPGLVLALSVEPDWLAGGLCVPAGTT